MVGTEKVMLVLSMYILEELVFKRKGADYWP